MAFSNADKLKHGISAQAGLENILKRCLQSKYIISVIANYRTGKTGFINTQFYTPFLIEFTDGTKWALFTTTSMRTDRIKGQQWDALNLKEINPQITSVFLVYPDGVSADIRADFQRQNNKYANKEEYSAIDAIVSQDEISNLIENYAIQDKNKGQKKDIQGNSYENRIATILSYKENFIKWKTGKATLEGMHYDVFKTIMDCFCLDRNTVVSISATSDKKVIGRLPSGGNPKTDVLVTVKEYNNATTHFTISCKRSSEKSVSVHQYSADTFSKVLNPDDNNLRKLLNGFQQAGSQKNFGIDNCIALEDALSPYLDKLAMWVLGGFGGEGTKLQCANYILTYDNETGSSSIHGISDYYYNLISAGVTGNFGTIFSWTYASGCRGKSIQLKCKIIK